MGFKKWLGRLISFFMGRRKYSRSRCIIKIEDHIEEWYILWSIVSGAPLSRGLHRSDFETWHLKMFPKISSTALDEQLDEAYRRGTDHPDYESCEEVIYYNKAGRNGKWASKEEIIAIYCEQYDQFSQLEANKKSPEIEWKVYTTKLNSSDPNKL